MARPLKDNALSEAALGLGVLVEVDFGGILVEPRCNLMLGFFKSHAIDVIDALTGLIVTPTIR